MASDHKKKDIPKPATMNPSPRQLASTTAPSRPARRWFQFSLRALLLVMVLTGFALTPIVYARRQAAQEQRAYALLNELGGACAGMQSARSPAWKLLLGDDGPGNISCAELRAPVTDSQLEQLTALTKLRRLTLSGSRLTDRGIVHLRRLPELRHLNLDDAPITAAGLQSLASLSSLTWLSLGDTRLPPAAIDRLQQQLPQLTIVDSENDWPARRAAE